MIRRNGHLGLSFIRGDFQLKIVDEYTLAFSGSIKIISGKWYILFFLLADWFKKEEPSYNNSLKKWITILLIESFLSLNSFQLGCQILEFCFFFFDHSLE
jgi:hypothetical protein